MREFHIIAGILLIALAFLYPASWLIQLLFIVGGAVNVGIAATWDDRR